MVPLSMIRTSRLAALALAGCLACSAGFAEKPEWAGGGKPGKEQKHAEKHAEKAEKKAGKNKNRRPVEAIGIGAYFGEPQRQAARAYYEPQFKAGRCPPGLAKKNNGCLPPGQAKKYVIGQPLPRDVVFYPVPAPMIVRLGQPPAGHMYVRVATDILLIAIGSSIVVDAIQDLNSL